MKKYLIIALITIETLCIIGLYFYGLIRKIEAEKAWVNTVRLEEQLEVTKMHLEQAKTELENCHQQIKR
jgi:hypothetical protein